MKNATEIKIKLMRLGITQQQIADECGVSKSLVSMVIKGVRQNVVVSKCISKTIQVKEAETALRSSEGKYKQLIRELPVGIEEIDEEGKIVYVNPAFEKIFKCRAEDIIGKYIWRNSATEEEKLKVKKTFENILKGTQKDKILETRVMSGNGEVLDLEVRWNRSSIKKNKKVAVTSIIIDITERKRYREKIEKTRSNYINIFASNPIPSVIFKRKDKDFVVDRFNRMSYKKSEKKIKEFQDQPISYFFDEGHFFRKMLNKCFLTERNFKKSRWFLSPFTGKKFFCEFNLVFFGPESVIVYFHDQTKEKQYTDLLESISSRLETALNASDSFWLEIDTDMKKIFIDPKLSEYLEYGEVIEEVKLSELDRFVFEDDLFFVKRKLDAVINGKLQKIDIDFRVNKPFNDYRWFNIIGSVYTADKRRKKYKFSGIVKDISSRKVEELERLKLNSELESFNRTLTHDIRNPLTIITGYSEILLQELSPKLDDEYRDYIKTIYSNCERLQSLTESLRRLSEVRRKSINSQKIDLKEMVEKIFKDLLLIYRDKKISLRISDGIDLKADKELMELVFNNLMENSIKYSKDDEKTSIEIGVIPGDNISEEKKDIIFIRDNGIGFNKRYSKEIFAEFKRVDTSNKPGHGIGLAIVKKAIERMNGYIWADSEPGVGSTFYILI